MKWISADERLPERSTGVLVHNNDAPGLKTGHYKHCTDINTVVAARWGTGGDWEWICYMDMVLDPRCPFTPTHWMPLPEPPEGE